MSFENVPEEILVEILRRVLVSGSINDFKSCLKVNHRWRESGLYVLKSTCDCQITAVENCLGCKAPPDEFGVVTHEHAHPASVIRRALASEFGRFRKRRGLKIHSNPEQIYVTLLTRRHVVCGYRRASPCFLHIYSLEEGDFKYSVDMSHPIRDMTTFFHGETEFTLVIDQMGIPTLLDIERRLILDTLAIKPHRDYAVFYTLVLQKTPFGEPTVSIGLIPETNEFFFEVLQPFQKRMIDFFRKNPAQSRHRMFCKPDAQNYSPRLGVCSMCTEIEPMNNLNFYDLVIASTSTTLSVCCDRDVEGTSLSRIDCKSHKVTSHLRGDAISALLFEGNVLFLGTSRGQVHGYVVRSYDDLLNPKLSSPNFTIKGKQRSPVLSISVNTPKKNQTSVDIMILYKNHHLIVTKEL